jgi:hypothetical protein
MNGLPRQQTEPHLAGRQIWQMRIPSAENPFKPHLVMAIKVYAHLATVLVLVTMGLQFLSGEPITLAGAVAFCLGQLGLIDEMAKPHGPYRYLRLIPSVLMMILGGTYQAFLFFNPLP